MRQQLQGTGVSVTRNGDNLILNMPGNITFANESIRCEREFLPGTEFGCVGAEGI